MPHVPDPLGSYPMVLRDYMVPNARKGELLLNYENYDLYYVNYQTGVKISMAQDIYDRIMMAKLQNTYFNLCDADKEDPVPGRNEIWPPVAERKYNQFYYVIRSRAANTTEIINYYNYSGILTDNQKNVPVANIPDYSSGLKVGNVIVDANSNMFVVLIISEDGSMFDIGKTIGKYQ